MKALIVEDDFFVRSLLSTILSEYGECHVAVNGQEALIALEIAINDKVPYDLVCLDIVMPVMDGQQALMGLRKLEQAKGISDDALTKVIMITAVDDSQKVMDAFRYGQCEAYLTKPLDRDQLLKHIADLGLSDKQRS